MEIPDIELSCLISNGMVIQRETKCRIWGRAVPKGQVSLDFCNKTYTAVSDGSGYFDIYLDELKAGGPHEMIIRCAGKEKHVSDILVGDVYILGGQSNMQIPVSRTLDLFEEEVKGACEPGIRQFTVPMVYNFNKQVDDITGGSWTQVDPSTVYSFSAIGYFFAKKVRERHDIPIGFILTALGGTPAEAWISEKTLMRFGRFQEILAICKDDSYVNGTIQREEKRNNRWYHELYETDEGLHGETSPWYSGEMDDSEWNSIELPAYFSGTELESIRGSVWFRKEILIPEHMAGASGKLVLGTLIDGDDTYLNGVLVGNTGYMYPPRRYRIPEGLLRAGKNTIAVRLIMTGNTGAFITGMPYMLKAGGSSITLSGTWKYKLGTAVRPLAPTTFFQYKPTGVFNGMIYPLRRYAARGVLWYQGEANTGYPYDYKELFEALVKDWRDNWGSNLPFLYVQLPNFGPSGQEPEVSGWARLREEQRKALEIPETGMAVAIDVGQYNDLHPQNKKAVGQRLALWALKLLYGEDIVCSGPIYESMDIEGNTAILRFTHTGGGLTAKGEELKGFEMCGQDGVFYPARARLEGDKVRVSCSLVSEPAHVRYAWADNPVDASLFNMEELPASPFTTK